jgi:hypothetical protein
MLEISRGQDQREGERISNGGDRSLRTSFGPTRTISPFVNQSQLWELAACNLPYFLCSSASTWTHDSLQMSSRYVLYHSVNAANLGPGKSANGWFARLNIPTKRNCASHATMKQNATLDANSGGESTGFGA